MKDDQMVPTEAPYEGKKGKGKSSTCTSAASAEHSRAHDDDAASDYAMEGNGD